MRVKAYDIVLNGIELALEIVLNEDAWTMAWEAFYLLNMGSLMNDSGLKQEYLNVLDEHGIEPSQEQIEKIEVFLDKERKAKYKQYKNYNSAMLSLGAGALLRYGMLSYLHFSGNDQKSEEETTLEIYTPEMITKALEVFSAQEDIANLSRDNIYRYNEMGKPYFVSGEPYFSLSHSGRCVLGAFSTGEIGVDLQEVTEDTDWRKLSKRFFAKTEQEYIMREGLHSESRGLEAFFRIWCRKEAYGKYLGTGLVQVLQEDISQNISNGRLKEGSFKMEGTTYLYTIYR